MKSLLKLWALIMAILISYSNSDAQTLGESSQKFGKHISITALLGPTINAPSKSIEEGMRTYGFGDTNPGGCFFFFCIPETAYPNSYSEFSWMGKLTYHLDPNYGIGLMYSANNFGEIIGYNSSVGRLGIEHDLKSISPQFTLGYYDIISLSAGPALHSLKIRVRDSNASKINRKLGVGADISFRVPKKSLFFVTLDVRYMLAGNYSVGPFSKTSNGTTVTFRKMKVNYNQLTVNYGFGIRL